jgi:putative membrane protein
MNKKISKTYNAVIIVVSVLIPVVVAFLSRWRIPNVAPLDMLPPIYAIINGATAILLVVAVMQIKRGNKRNHQMLMKINIMLSLLFLIMYIAYHVTSDMAIYGGVGISRSIYYFILASHIILSGILVPLVLFTYKHAALGQYDNHRKLAKITFPIWFYVAVTGVVVYLMISPYYN